MRKGLISSRTLSTFSHVSSRISAGSLLGALLSSNGDTMVSSCSEDRLVDLLGVNAGLVTI